MRYAIVTSSGEVKEHEADVLDAETIGTAVGTPSQFRAIEPDEDCVFFVNNDPLSAFPFNWLATNALRRRLHPEGRVTGDALVTGPTDFEGHPTDISDEVIERLRESAQR